MSDHNKQTEDSTEETNQTENAHPDTQPKEEGLTDSKKSGEEKHEQTADEIMRGQKTATPERHDWANNSNNNNIV
ncbi:MAG: hypothetical protein ABIT96_12335 [Ferruginibacter sp.]